MEGFEKLELPPWFLPKVESVDDLRKLDEFDVMVRVVGAEAEGETSQGQKAVAHVIMNRLNNPRRFGKDIKSVLLNDPNQFEPVAKASSPDEKLSKRDFETKRKILGPKGYYSPGVLQRVIDSAGAVYFGGEADNTGGADHFHSKKEVPWWGPSMDATATIGGQVFRKSR